MHARENRPATSAQITACHLGDQLAALNPSLQRQDSYTRSCQHPFLSNWRHWLDTELSVQALIPSYIQLARDHQLRIWTLPCFTLIVLCFCTLCINKSTNICIYILLVEMPRSLGSMRVLFFQKFWCKSWFVR